MRETINEQTADNHSAAADNIQADGGQQTGSDPNHYLFEGYKIHERFNPEGPPFADCIVRVFA